MTGEAGTAPTGADRLLATLRSLGRHPEGIGLNEIARGLNSPKSSVHRALASLRKADLVDQDAEGRYRLSYGFLKLAFSYYERVDDVTRVRPALSSLAEWAGETTHYGVLEDSEIVYVAKVQPGSAHVRMTSVIGGRNPAHCTGVGKVLLAYRLRTLESVQHYAATYGPLERRTPATLVEPDDLHKEFQWIRRRGFGMDREESEPGINCLSLPLFLTSRSEPDGAISITALVQRHPVERLAAEVDEVRRIVRDKLGDVTGEDRHNEDVGPAAVQAGQHIVRTKS